MEIPFIVLAVMFVAVVIGWSETWKKKEHYRCRVFELSNGEEGSNLVKVIPNTPAPKPPKVKYFRHYWQFINPTAVPQERLDVMVGQMQYNGYHFDKEANACGLLAFKRVEEVEGADESEFSMKSYE